MTEDQATMFLSEFQTACQTAHDYASSYMSGLIILLGVGLFMNCILVFYIAYKISRK